MIRESSPERMPLDSISPEALRMEDFRRPTSDPMRNLLEVAKRVNGANLTVGPAQGTDPAGLAELEAARQIAINSAKSNLTGKL